MRLRLEATRGDLRCYTNLARTSPEDLALVLLYATVQPDVVVMGASLIQWFIYSNLVGVFAAYVTGRVLGAGANYMGLFRFAGTKARANDHANGARWRGSRELEILRAIRPPGATGH